MKGRTMNKRQALSVLWQRSLTRHLRWMYLCFTVAVAPTALSFFGDWLLWAFVALTIWSMGMWHRRKANKCNEVLEILEGDTR